MVSKHKDSSSYKQDHQWHSQAAPLCLTITLDPSVRWSRQGFGHRSYSVFLLTPLAGAQEPPFWRPRETQLYSQYFVMDFEHPLSNFVCFFSLDIFYTFRFRGTPTLIYSTNRIQLATSVLRDFVFEKAGCGFFNLPFGPSYYYTNA